MKLIRCRQLQRSPDAGSTMVLVLIILGISMLLIGSYMGLALDRSKIAMRSAAWNQAIAVAEAGIEEGLAQIQYSTAPTNGWALANGMYTKTRSNPFGDDTYFSVLLYPTSPAPIITATGYVRAPLMSSYIQRVVQVTTTIGTNQYPYGLHSKGAITISGGSVVDSFDSSDPNYSIGGRYDPLRHKANCYVSSESGAANVLQVGTGRIFGYVETSAGVGTVSVGSSGAVGDNSYVSNALNQGTIQMSPQVHALTNNNMDIVDVTLPAGLTSGSAPSSGTYTVGGTNYNYCLGNGTNYFSGSFTIPGGQSMVITGKCTFYVAGSFTISGSGFIYIGTNASLTLYVGTSSAGNDSITISGGGVANGTQLASNLAIFGLPSVKTATYSGSSVFIGTSDTPDADATLSGSAMGCGAVVAQTVTLSGGMNFHYDESRGGSPYPKYTVVSWREL